MIQLKKFINESIESKRVDRRDLQSLLTTKYRDAFELFWRKNYFWRGHRSVSYDFLEVFPARGERFSVDENNIYTVLLSKLPSWKNYPKRSHSLIFANSQYVTLDYGNRQVFVFPENKAKIVTSGVRDVLSHYTLPAAMDKYKISIMDIANLDGISDRLYVESHKTHMPHDEEKYKRGIMNISVSEYDIFMKDLQKYSTPKNVVAVLKDVKKQGMPSGHQSVYHARLQKILTAFIKTRKKHGWNWEKFLDILMNPEDNNFQLLSLDDFDGPHYKDPQEMWTDADCLLVSETDKRTVEVIAKEVFGKHPKDEH